MNSEEDAATDLQVASRNNKELVLADDQVARFAIGTQLGETIQHSAGE